MLPIYCWQAVICFTRSGQWDGSQYDYTDQKYVQHSLYVILLTVYVEYAVVLQPEHKSQNKPWRPKAICSAGFVQDI